MSVNVNAEVELANARIAELQAQLNVYKRQEEHLVPLPNGDLHRGFRKFNADGSNVDVEVLSQDYGNPLDRAMAKILSNKRIDQPNHVCLWCGLQFDAIGSETSIREHLKKDHASVVEGYDKPSAASLNEQVLMASLSDAQDALAKKK